MFYYFPIPYLAIKRSRSTKGYHLYNLGSTSFKAIGPLVWEKKNLKVWALYGNGGHIDQVTSTV